MPSISRPSRFPSSFPLPVAPAVAFAVAFAVALLLTSGTAVLAAEHDEGSDEAAADSAVEHAPGVEAHAGVDAVYATFRRAYQTLDPALVGGLYTDEALYLQPNSDVIRGREPIQGGFAAFFDAVREADGNLDITFEIVDRDVMADGVVDVGIYRIVRDGSRVTRGKFAVVAVPVDDAWRFRLDAFNPMPPSDG